MERAWVQSLVMELDPTRGNQDLVQPKKKKKRVDIPKEMGKNSRGRKIRDLLKIPKEKREDH